MKIEWMGKYRSFVASIFRSGNAYAQIVKQPTSGDEVKFGPYEVQIMEHILEYGEQNYNMIWYARQLGMIPSTFSKTVKRLVDKGLVEKYHTSENKKNVILRLTPFGQKEYRKYAVYAYDMWFKELFALLDTMTDEEIEKTQKVIDMYGRWCNNLAEEKPVELIKVK